MAKTKGAGPGRKPAKVAQARSTRTLSQKAPAKTPPRSNAGGAVRGRARAAQVKGMRTTGRLPGPVAGTALTAGQRATMVRARHTTGVAGKPAAGASPVRAGSTPSGVGIGFNAMVRRGAGNAILDALNKR